ncbi:hypothetical protein BGW80DRAFT_1344405 [Lactifluus volemus]|nr:hypothetical protein BGW80DRAFT_1344405 [Lactifluus volemus]
MIRVTLECDTSFHAPMADSCHCRSMDGCWQAGVSRRAGMDKLRKAGAGIGGGEMRMGTGVSTRWAIPGLMDIPYSCLQILKEVNPTAMLTVLSLSGCDITLRKTESEDGQGDVRVMTKRTNTTPSRKIQIAMHPCMLQYHSSTLASEHDQVHLKPFSRSFSHVRIFCSPDPDWSHPDTPQTASRPIMPLPGSCWDF